MGNCLLTKLKGSVQNPELKTFGKLRVNVIPNGTNTVMNLRWDFDVNNPSIEVFDSTGTLLGTVIGDSRYAMLNSSELPVGAAYINIPYKYKLEIITISGGLAFGFDDFSDICYSEEISELRIGWASVKNSSPLSELIRLSNLVTVEIQSLPLIGSIAEIADMQNLEYIDINSCSSIEGSIESLAEAIYAKYSEKAIGINAPQHLFNNVQPDNIVGISKNSGVLTVSMGDVVKGTYDGSIWTYNN